MDLDNPAMPATSGAANSGSSVNNVKWLDHAKNMLDTQRHIYQHSTMTDVIVVAGSQRCKAHQLVLGASSDFFRAALAIADAGGAPPANTIPANVYYDGPTIIIPDMGGHLLEPLMAFIYTGEALVVPTTLSEFLEACNYLQIKGFLNYACMVNGIQLKKQEQQQPQPEPVEQYQPVVYAQPAAMPVHALSTSVHIQQLTAPPQQFQPSNTPTTNVDSNSAIYGTLQSTELNDHQQQQQQQQHQPESGQEFIVESVYVKTDGSPSEEATAIELGSSSPAHLLQLDQFEEYLDDDEDDCAEDEDIGIPKHTLEAGEIIEHDGQADSRWETLEQSATSATTSDGLIASQTLHYTDTAEESTLTVATVDVNTKPVKRSPRTARTPAAAKTKATIPSNQPAPSPTAIAADVSPVPAGSKSSKTYSDETLAAAMLALKAGSSVMEIAAQFDIPRSTIYARMRCGRERVYRQYHQEKLDDAVKGVTETGMSLKEASLKFDVSKTVLWRALKKSKIYRPEDRITLTRADALVAIQRGDTLISISKAYNVPLATLHRDKVRLYHEGKLPDHCKLRRRDIGMGYRSRLNAAVTSCRNGMPQKIASEVHGVPKTTIWRHLQRAIRADAVGGQAALGEEGAFEIKRDEDEVLEEEEEEEEDEEIDCDMEEAEQILGTEEVLGVGEDEEVYQDIECDEESYKEFEEVECVAESKDVIAVDDILIHVERVDMASVEEL